MYCYGNSLINYCCFSVDTIKTQIGCDTCVGLWTKRKCVRFVPLLYVICFKIVLFCSAITSLSMLVTVSDCL